MPHHEAKELKEKLSVSHVGGIPEEPMMLTRAIAACHIDKLQLTSCGTDGIDLSQNLKQMLADPMILLALGNWIEASGKGSSVMWAKFPHEYESHEGYNSANMVALGLISIAVQADAPFVSFICKRPHRSEVKLSMEPKEAGLLSMVHSVIRQLLEFRPDKEDATIPLQWVEQLNCGISGWKASLKMLDHLLRHTTTLRYYIIHGLNELEEAAEGKCLQFLEILQRWTHDCSHPMGLLFTTSGLSRVLFQCVPEEDQAQTEMPIRQVELRGQETCHMLQQSCVTAQPNQDELS